MAAGEILTAETLHAQRHIARASQATQARGVSYFRQGRVQLRSVDLHEALFSVRGSERYEVHIWLDDGVNMVCSCPFGGTTDYPCKHLIACLIALNTYLRQNPPTTWESIVSQAASAAIPKPIDPSAKQLLVFSLQHRYADWFVVPYSLPLNLIPPDVDLNDAYTVAAEIAHGQVDKLGKPLRSLGKPERFANISDDAQIAAQFALLSQRYGNYYGYDTDGGIGRILPHLNQCALLSGTESRPFQMPLRIADLAAQPMIEINDTARGLEIKAGIRSAGISLVLDPKNTITFLDKPLWLQVGNCLYRVDDPSGIFLIFLRSPDLVIPPDEKPSFFERYLLPLAARITVSGTNITDFGDDCDPIPRLYLSESHGDLQAALRFGYGDYELAYQKDAPEASLQQTADAMTLVRVHRKPQIEQDQCQKLSAFQGLKRGAEPGLFALRANTDPIEFLLHTVPRLAEAGFEIYGENALTTARLNRSKPTISFAVSSGIDWFDVAAVAHFGEIEVSLREIRRAVRKRERYIKLTDGSIGVIPDDWLERYRHLFGMSEETDEGLRLANSQITLLDQLLAEGDRMQADAEFERRRERLRDFGEIKPQVLPSGLSGTLRPYQKAGFDWLHFLHDYEFGGCLADDMGTGKTFTALAFLQSLKERGSATAATLLVLPRSLIFNWEREVEKWTPGLTILNHAHNARAKEQPNFDQYDLVLTTYGILLRDIEMLRQYRFHYAVLDEAQAIKNPVSQTAKAARLLNADHRLTLTGTPVENSTLELWSQFSFLNPGLLGNIEYFRAEFSNAIEKNRDEVAAAFLRKMVHPFILRRTKDQVAPDLPPRTERILYTDMESAQHKLYDQKRDYYRAQVMGMIEKEGINDARMKILEGLLRLRQIANHPRLVEPQSKASSAKLESLLETLETLQSEGHKALVFSQFVQMLKIVRTELDARKIPYAYLDGKVKDRQAAVDEFQNNSAIPFFLISLKAGGVGLNLTAADYVIHIDPWWNPAVEMQATDRTHRIGQDKPVFVYKLIARDTVEEKILLLQDRKRELVSKLIATEGSFFKSLTRDDVAMLFG